MKTFLLFFIFFLLSICPFRVNAQEEANPIVIQPEITTEIQADPSSIPEEESQITPEPSSTTEENSQVTARPTPISENAEDKTTPTIIQPKTLEEQKKEAEAKKKARLIAEEKQKKAKEDRLRKQRAKERAKIEAQEREKRRLKKMEEERKKRIKYLKIQQSIRSGIQHKK